MSAAPLRREPVLTDVALGWAQRGVWALCIGVYLTVFVGGLLAGGDELLSMARAIGLTLVTAFLSKTAVGLLARASQPVQQGPSADQVGPVGSLTDVVGLANVAAHDNTAELA
jgi:hypothetical protein